VPPPDLSHTTARIHIHDSYIYTTANSAKNPHPSLRLCAPYSDRYLKPPAPSWAPRQRQQGTLCAPGQRLRLRK
jgi:hypothetical protein